MICGYCKEDKLGVILNILNDLPCYIKVHVNHIENIVHHVEYKEKKKGISLQNPFHEVH